MKFTYKDLIVWFIYIVFLFILFDFFIDHETAIIHTLITTILQAIIYYGNLYFILPRFFEHKKYLTYIFINFLFIGFGLITSELSEEYTKFHFDREESLDMESIMAHSITSLLAIFASFFSYTYYKNKQQEEKELAIVNAEKDFLIQQINPHFFFNTLNNIYSLTLDQDPKGSEAIMQLSKMFDYSLYSGKKGALSLKEEVAYIHHFIALFKLKDDSIETITFDHKEANLDFKITPMLLIPFIENAFKHGDIETNTKGFIDIKLKSTHNQLEFNCTNSYSGQKSVDKTGGIGIQNVSRRLELIYHKAHSLKIDKEDKKYTISLKISSNEA